MSLSRAFNAAAEILMNALHLPFMTVLVEFSELEIYITNFPRDVTIGSTTYVGTHATDDEFALKVKGISENLKFEAPSATIDISSLEGVWQARFLNDTIRDNLVTIKIAYVDTTDGSVKESGWSVTFRCDMDSADEDVVSLRLASGDAAKGEEYPKNTNQDYACQNVLSRGRCYYRQAPGAAVSLLTCDHGYDTPNGCKTHFPDITHPITGDTIPQPKPFNGNISHIDRDFILRGP